MFTMLAADTHLSGHDRFVPSTCMSIRIIFCGFKYFDLKTRKHLMVRQIRSIIGTAKHLWQTHGESVHGGISQHLAYRESLLVKV